MDFFSQCLPLVGDTGKCLGIVGIAEPYLQGSQFIHSGGAVEQFVHDIQVFPVHPPKLLDLAIGHFQVHYQGVE